MGSERPLPAANKGGDVEDRRGPASARPSRAEGRAGLGWVERASLRPARRLRSLAGRSTGDPGADGTGLLIYAANTMKPVGEGPRGGRACRPASGQHRRRERHRSRR